MTRFASAFAALLLIGAPLAQAQDDEFGDDPTYSALRLTQVKSGFDNLDSAINLGFTIGIMIPPLSPYLAAEIDLSSTLIPGENSGAVTPGTDGGGGGLLPGGGGGGGSSSSGGKNTRSGSDLQVNTVGLFATARSGGKFYGLARVGYRLIQSSIPELDEDGTGSAWGLGFGYRYGRNASAELNYNQYGSDLNYLSLVINY